MQPPTGVARPRLCIGVLGHPVFATYAEHLRTPDSLRRLSVPEAGDFVAILHVAAASGSPLDELEMASLVVVDAALDSSSTRRPADRRFVNDRGAGCPVTMDSLWCAAATSAPT